MRCFVFLNSSDNIYIYIKSHKMSETTLRAEKTSISDYILLTRAQERSEQLQFIKIVDVLVTAETIYSNAVLLLLFNNFEGI